MKTQSFIVTNKEEELDLLQTIERERPKATYHSGYKPTEWVLSTIGMPFPFLIQLKGDLVAWAFLSDDPSASNWQIGMTLPPLPKSALEQLTEIPENEDGSITISKELQVQLVMEGGLK
jgi:hypothetical protein